MRSWAALFIGLPLLLGRPVRAATITAEDCVRLAVERSPATRASGSEFAAASARVRAARAAYIPRLLAQGAYGRSEGFDEVVTDGGVTAALLTVEATLFDGGVRDAQLGAARARMRSAAAIDQQRRADVALGVRAAYFAALAARAEGEIQSDSIGSLEAYLEFLRRQEHLGLVPRNDVLRAELAVAAARSVRRTAAAELETARGELVLLAGVDVPQEALAEPERSPFVAPTDEMIDASPLVADARESVEAARQEADVVRGEWRGQANLTLSGGALGVRPDKTFRDNGGGQFLFGINVPLFDGGATAARIRAAVEAVNTAEANLELVRQTMAIDLSRAGAEATRAADEVAMWELAVPRAAEHFQLMRARYAGGGNVRLLEVLDAMAQYAEARLNVPRALEAQRLADATARRIVGEAIR